MRQIILSSLLLATPAMAQTPDWHGAQRIEIDLSSFNRSRKKALHLSGSA